VDLDAAQILREDSSLVEEHLQRVLGLYADAPEGLVEAIRYSLMGGGKRLRPALVIEAARAVEKVRAGPSSQPVNGALSQGVYAAACAVELIHTFSLVHDDLPAMDDDDLRRGRPTNHKVFGEAMAILAGDAMVTMAFELLAGLPGDLAGRLAAELARASGPMGMIGGQVMDMEGEKRRLTLEQLKALHARKTGALLTASCRMGAIAAGASDGILAAMTAYGQCLGLAFQIVDDLLDATGSAEELGKATNKDAARGKNTYPLLMGIEKSRREAQDQLASALRAIEPLGIAGGRLRSLAEFVVVRNR